MSQTSHSSRPDLFYLVGTSAHPNYGDEFIAAAWLRYLAQRHPDVPVILDCPKPGLASLLFEGLHPHLQTTDVVWRTVWESKDLPPDEADARVDQVMRHLGSPLYDVGLLSIRRATRIHLIGGGHITSHWPFHILLFRAALTLGSLAGAPVAATGLGLLPCSAPDYVRRQLAEFDHATARDEPSAEIAGIPLAPDDAFLALPILPGFDSRPTPSTGQPGDIWVCLQRDLAHEAAFEAILTAARKFLTSDLAVGRSVRYAESLPGVDRVAFDRLSDLIPEENFVPFAKLWGQPFPARPRQIWLTTRFHLHLLAAACGASGTAFEIDEDNYRAKHQSLVAAGTGWSVSPAGSDAAVTPAGGNAFRVEAKRMHRAKVLEAEKIYP